MTRSDGLLGVRKDHVVQLLGYDTDCDDTVVAAVADAAGIDPVNEDHDDVVDVVLLWWRDDDGDLVDALLDATTLLDERGQIWVLTPKLGRDGHVEPEDLSEAGPTSGRVSSAAVRSTPDLRSSRATACWR